MIISILLVRCSCFYLATFFSSCGSYILFAFLCACTRDLLLFTTYVSCVQSQLGPTHQ